MGMPPALVFITVDCLRADHTGFLGYDRPTTPFLDSLAKENLVFSNAIVAGAPTYYSFPAIMSSRYPLALGRDVIGIAPGEPTIASALQQAEYSTAAFLAGNPYLSRRFGYQNGFDVFRDGLDVNSPETSKPAAAVKSGTLARWNQTVAEISHKLGSIGSVYDELYFQYCQRVAMPASSMAALRRFPGADAIVDQACAWLDGIGQRPFFLWLHLMDPHSPYYPTQAAMEHMGANVPTAHRARYLNSYWNRGDLDTRRLNRHRDEVLALYDAGIRWVDTQIARLVDSLRDLGRWDNCVFALTADHGEEFLEHGGRYHSPSQVGEEVIRVPLLVRAGTTGRAVAEPFSLVHLAPTLLEALGVQGSPSFHGHSHWSQLQTGSSWDSHAIVESVGGCTNPFRADKRMGPRILVVREARYKLVLDFGGAAEKLFDLENDPKEIRPLALDAERPVRRRLLDRALRHVTDSSAVRDSDRRTNALLRDLRLEWTNLAIQIST